MFNCDFYTRRSSGYPTALPATSCLLALRERRKRIKYRDLASPLTNIPLRDAARTKLEVPYNPSRSFWISQVQGFPSDNATTMHYDQNERTSLS